VTRENIAVLMAACSASLVLWAGFDPKLRQRLGKRLSDHLRLSRFKRQSARMSKLSKTT